MRQRIGALLLALFFALTCVNMFAHSGGTDSSGGHNNRSTGEYHYHHGYPAHYHLDGVCPYDDGVLSWKEQKIQEAIDDEYNSGQQENIVKAAQEANPTAKPTATPKPTATTKPTVTPKPTHNSVISETTSSDDDSWKFYLKIIAGETIVIIVLAYICLRDWGTRDKNKAVAQHLQGRVSALERQKTEWITSYNTLEQKYDASEERCRKLMEERNALEGSYNVLKKEYDTLDAEYRRINAIKDKHDIP